eukprot:3757234-Rhodomonas_salina.1
MTPSPDASAFKSNDSLDVQVAAAPCASLRASARVAVDKAESRSYRGSLSGDSASGMRLSLFRPQKERRGKPVLRLAPNGHVVHARLH